MRSSRSTCSRMARPFSCTIPVEGLQRLEGLVGGEVALVLGDVRARAPKLSNIRRLSRFGSLKVIAGSRYSMLRSAKKSFSLVNAAFITLGVPETTGHDAVSMTPSRRSARG
jgi:hypothetical protein